MKKVEYLSFEHKYQAFQEVYKYLHDEQKLGLTCKRFSASNKIFEKLNANDLAILLLLGGGFTYPKTSK